MKKSVLFRVALVMLVLTMVTSCFVGGTFAKYVTSGEGADSARVAKFGVVVTGNGTAFAEMYDDEAVAAASYATVVSDLTGDIKDLVAPGTKGNMVSMTLAGKPEVNVEVSYEAEVELGDNWIDKDDTSKFYCPLKVTVAGTTLCGLDYNSADAFETAIEDNIAAYSKSYSAGTDLSTVAGDSLAVSWEWPFVADGTYAVNQQTDPKDTFLGDRAAENVDDAATITLAVTTTVTQID